MDGTRVKSLSATKTAAPAISHEAKLGMMVITILMVAFGFLVYHKMDLHERQLTQASISSTAENGAVDEETPHLDNAGRPKPANETILSTANDPLLSRTDLSDGSPFQISGMNFAEAPATTKSATEQFVTTGAGADDAEPNSNGIEDSSLPIFAFSEPLESSVDTQSAGNSGESEKAAESSRLDQLQDTTIQQGAESDTRLAMLDVTPGSSADSGRVLTDAQRLDVTFFPTESVSTPASQREDAGNRISPNDSVPVFASTDPETP